MILNQQNFSAIGKRSENQDSLAYLSISNDYAVACIADGVGGLLGGKEASSAAVNHFIEPIQKRLSEDKNFNSLEDVLSEMNKMIIKVQEKQNYKKRIGTTFTGLIISKNKITGIHTGDTRCYILRGNGLKQLTEDHTEVARLYQEGKLTKEDYSTYPRKNVIESALGINEKIPIVQKFEFDFQPKDRLILSTDGIHESVSKINFRDISLSSSSSEEFISTLQTYLKRVEPNDNQSMILISYLSK
jgi:protein phosphatase